MPSIAMCMHAIYYANEVPLSYIRGLPPDAWLAQANLRDQEIAMELRREEVLDICWENPPPPPPLCAPNRPYQADLEMALAMSLQLEDVEDLARTDSMEKDLGRVIQADTSVL
jgi:hypothetical protein